MIVAGANRLEENKKEVDELNVFPVPDGDTGTNMSLTVMSAAREVLKAGDDASVEVVAKALSSGALRGARGNSGVIVSQLFRGMYRGLKGTEEIDAAAWANAMRQGVETAYKAVMRPKEGTILTVARGMAEAAVDAAIEEEDLAELLKLVIERGEEVLEKTPDMLPVLKEAGVVDAGGKGLLYIYKGMYEALT
ncbi:MAG TPA: DAK2 domain-containing protein, partial [Candidatus Faecimorpha stercoravium]|nr:DAK2 domain-containing protein [Candidatus Faecimorpha stercoravium]